MNDGLVTFSTYDSNSNYISISARLEYYPVESYVVKYAYGTYGSLSINGVVEPSKYTGTNILGPNGPDRFGTVFALSDGSSARLVNSGLGNGMPYYSNIGTTYNVVYNYDYTSIQNPYSISIDTVGGDGLINNDRAHAPAGVPISGSTAGAPRGSVVSVSFTEGTFSKTYTANVDSSGRWSTAIPTSDAVTLTNGQATVTAQLITPQGDRSDHAMQSVKVLISESYYYGTRTGVTSNYNSIIADDLGDYISGSYQGIMNITGGMGYDKIYFTSVVSGGRIYGGGGNDYINTIAVSPTTTNLIYLDGGSGQNDIYGGGLLDILRADGNSSMHGSTVAGALNTFFDGYLGYNVMYGGANAKNDFHLFGGHATVYGGNSGDRYWIDQTPQNTIFAGNGDDVISDTTGSNSIHLGDGNDVVWAQSANNTVISGGAGNKSFYVGGTSHDSTVVVTGGSGNDVINGLGGQSVLYIQPGTGSGVNVVVGGDYSNHIYGQINTGTLFMRGGRGVDEMVGGQGSNTFIGEGGGDFVRGAGLANAFDFNRISDGNLHIANFNVTTDHFGISASGFGSQLYGGETLLEGYNLINGTASTAQTGTFLYHDAGLYFDADGTGSIAPVLLAGLTAGSNAVPTALSHNNFVISGDLF